MTGFETFWEQGDAITRGVALLLLLMSVSAWVLILWKGRVLTDIASSSVATVRPMASVSAQNCASPSMAAAAAQPKPSTSFMSNRPRAWPARKRAARKLPWA